MIEESLDRLAEIATPTNPFPGLRPFEFRESHLFFGRENQIDSLIEKLSRTHFLAIIGTSGSGKSSLVRAGLLPALIGGLMSNAGSVWHVALLRPGNDPIGNLARALNSRDAFGSEAENRSLQIAITEATLRRGNLGLVEAVRQVNMPASENLLVIIDQFEELFRIAPGAQQEETENDKAAFVKLLLKSTRWSDDLSLPEASDERADNIYVVLTMRSDYLGDCSQFWDLPEAISGGQYLIPRLTLDQRRDAITGPVAVGSAEITPRLVNRLINDVGDNPDQLPILQHALMRTWDRWKEEQRPDTPLDLRHYEAVGGIAEALSRHADKAYNELSDDLRMVAEKVFKALTEKGPDNREIRRQIPLRDLCAIADAPESAVIAVIETFRQPRRSFLMPPADTRLTADSLIDISHESLIRVWTQLNEWVDEEARSAHQYYRLAETAKLYYADKAELWRGRELQNALEWREQNKPNPAWARRYHPGLSGDLAGLDIEQKRLKLEAAFHQALQFLEDSAQQRAAENEERERQQRLEEERNQRELVHAQVLAEEQKRRAEVEARSAMKLRRIVTALIVLSVVALIAAIIALDQKNEALEKGRTLSQLSYISDMNLAQKAFEDNALARGHELLNSYLPAFNVRDDLRDFDWYYLWGLHHHESATLRGHTDYVYSVAFSPERKLLASGGRDGAIKLWEVSTGKLLNTLGGYTHSILSVAFSADGKWLASGNWDKTIKLWEVSTGKLLNTLEGHGDPVQSVAFSPDGNVLASGSADNTIKLWEVSTGKLLNTLEGHDNTILSVAFSADSKLLASGSADNTIKLWEVSTGKLLNTLEGHANTIWSVAFSPDGNVLASGSWDKTIKLWEVSTGKLLNTFEGHTDSVLSVVFSPDGNVLASGSRDKTIKLWEVSTGKLLNTFEGHTDSVLSVAFSADGKLLASGSWDKTIKLWELNSSQLLKTFGGHGNAIYSVIFSADGKLLASGSADNTIKLWKVSMGKLLNTLFKHTNTVYSVAFSPDGKVLASGSGDKTIKLFFAATDQEVEKQRSK